MVSNETNEREQGEAREERHAPEVGILGVTLSGTAACYGCRDVATFQGQSLTHIQMRSDALVTTCEPYSSQRRSVWPDVAERWGGQGGECRIAPSERDRELEFSLR
ncbi:hypothetical protein J6590_011854 [Homalodisca vitripennis]|nr:hypothetical protein J6590_011854 [Homalodisca vitripennis]